MLDQQKIVITVLLGLYEGASRTRTKYEEEKSIVNVVCPTLNFQSSMLRLVRIHMTKISTIVVISNVKCNFPLNFKNNVHRMN